MSREMLPRRFALLGLITLLGLLPGRSAEPSHFDQANRLYEQGKFSEAASLYESMLKAGRRSPEIFYNLGNAYFREGRLGLALFNYRQAERASPRDPDIQANLRFTRERVAGALSVTDSFALRTVRYFTLNELTTAGTLLFWIWAALVCACCWRPALRARLRPARLILGVLAAIAMITVLCAYATTDEQIAIVTANQAPIRLGPVSESQTIYTATDGTELKASAKRGDWLQVIDRSERSGWIEITNVVIYAHRSVEQSTSATNNFP